MISAALRRARAALLLWQADRALVRARAAEAQRRARLGLSALPSALQGPFRGGQ